MIVVYRFVLSDEFGIKPNSCSWKYQLGGISCNCQFRQETAPILLSRWLLKKSPRAQHVWNNSYSWSCFGIYPLAVYLSIHGAFPKRAMRAAGNLLQGGCHVATGRQNAGQELVGGQNGWFSDDFGHVEGMLARYFSPKIYVGNSLVHFIQGNYTSRLVSSKLFWGLRNVEWWHCAVKRCVSSGLVSTVKITGDFSPFNPTSKILKATTAFVGPRHIAGTSQERPPTLLILRVSTRACPFACQDESVTQPW